MLDSLLLQVGNAEGRTVYQFMLIGGMLLVFYVFMVRPQQRRRKDQQVFLEELKKGAQVVTIGGIHGKVYAVSDDTLTLEVDNRGSKITVSKDAISLDTTRQHMQKKK